MLNSNQKVGMAKSDESLLMPDLANTDADVAVAANLSLNRPGSSMPG